MSETDFASLARDAIFADGWLITMNGRREVLDRASVAVVGDRIAAIGGRAILARAYPQAEVIDCVGKIVLPGMMNTHTHLFQTLLKGLGDDMELKRWFTCMTGPSALHLSVDDTRAAARHGCVESIRSGVTTLVDFMYVHTQSGMTEAVLDAFRETGMRGFVCRGFMSTGQEFDVPRGLIEDPRSALEDARALIRRHNRPGALVQVGVAPCMIWTVDEAGLRGARALAEEERVLLTTHVAETHFEIEQAAARYRMSDTEFLRDIGFLGPDVLAVHCVHCDRAAIGLLRRHSAKVSHNPCSNLYLASGVPPIPEMLREGITIGLGSDGPASSNNHSLFQAMKFAALLQKGVTRDATVMTAEKVLEMATIDGAKAVGLEREIGSIEIGKKADIIVIDCESPFMTPIHHPVSALVYSALGHETSSVMIDGRFVMRDGRLITVDEGATRLDAQRRAAALARRAGTDTIRTRI